MRNLAVLAVLGALCAYPADEAPARTISVLVFDFAGVPADILEPGMRESKRIMESAGVELVWADCPVAPEQLALQESCREATGPLTFVLHILPPGATRRQAEPGAMGFAVQDENGGFGAFAGVFHERIERLGATISGDVGLGHVIAHELGHLLLGTGHHSTGGIMKPDWRHKELKLAAEGRLNFDRAERRRVLENIQRRMRAAQTKPVQAFTVRRN